MRELVRVHDPKLTALADEARCTAETR